MSGDKKTNEKKSIVKNWWTVAHIKQTPENEVQNNYSCFVCSTVSIREFVCACMLRSGHIHVMCEVNMAYKRGSDFWTL